MGTRLLELGDWVKIDSDPEKYSRYMEIRRGLLASHRAEVSVSSSTSLPAQREALELLLEHLPRQYPHLFERTEAGLRERGTGREVKRDDADPLVAMASITQEDWVLMQPDETGAYVLTAGVVCFPMRWRLTEA
jgi:thymidylate synthase ThyX